jgi:alpha-1,3-mannosyltransferase
MKLYWLSQSIPNWALVILPLSKRLHSIYVLRMFNDAWALIPLLTSIMLYCKDEDALASLMFRFVILDLYLAI